MQNLFLKTPVPAEIQGLFAGDFKPSPPLPLTPQMPIFWHYAALQQQLPHVPTDDINLSSIHVEPQQFIRVDQALLEKDDVRNEIEFINALGLLYIAPSGDIYISPLAELLYGETIGIFGKEGRLTAEDVWDVLHLFERYVLPGRLWVSYIVRNGLSPDIASSTMLDIEMDEIQRQIDALRQLTSQ